MTPNITHQPKYDRLLKQIQELNQETAKLSEYRDEYFDQMDKENYSAISNSLLNIQEDLALFITHFAAYNPYKNQTREVTSEEIT